MEPNLAESLKLRNHYLEEYFCAKILELKDKKKKVEDDNNDEEPSDYVQKVGVSDYCTIMH